MWVPTLRHALDGTASLAETYADDLEERLREWGLEAPTLEEAALETGLAYDTLQKKVSRGSLPKRWREASPTGSPLRLVWNASPVPRRRRVPAEAILRRPAAG